MGPRCTVTPVGGGSVLLDTDGDEIATSRPAAPGQDRRRQSSEYLLAHAAVSNGLWQLELSQPRSEALAPVFRLRRVLVGSTLLLIPFAVLVAAGRFPARRAPPRA